MARLNLIVWFVIFGAFLSFAESESIEDPKIGTVEACAPDSMINENLSENPSSLSSDTLGSSQIKKDEAELLKLQQKKHKRDAWAGQKKIDLIQQNKALDSINHEQNKDLIKPMDSSKEELQSWLRWGGLGLILLGGGVVLATESNYPRMVGVSAFGLGVASVVWSFSF